MAIFDLFVVPHVPDELHRTIVVENDRSCLQWFQPKNQRESNDLMGLSLFIELDDLHVRVLVDLFHGREENACLDVSIVFK